MVYMYIVKHNYILGSMLTNTKAQLHASAINVGHLQVVHTTKNTVVFDDIHVYYLAYSC